MTIFLITWVIAHFIAAGLIIARAIAGVK